LKVSDPKVGIRELSFLCYECGFDRFSYGLRDEATQVPVSPENRFPLGHKNVF